jgi:hypothetical protein
MRTTFIAMTALTLLFAAGCKNNQSSTTAASSSSPSSYGSNNAAQASALSPEDLGTLGAQIKKQPNDADKLLAEKGLNAQSFATAIRKVSEDPAAAKRYAAAYKSAS